MTVTGNQNVQFAPQREYQQRVSLFVIGFVIAAGVLKPAVFGAE
jgi:hypothetical protein